VPCLDENNYKLLIVSAFYNCHVYQGVQKVSESVGVLTNVEQGHMKPRKVSTVLACLFQNITSHHQTYSRAHLQLNMLKFAN